jgi:hypothetical protein
MLSKWKGYGEEERNPSRPLLATGFLPITGFSSSTGSLTFGWKLSFHHYIR